MVMLLSRAYCHEAIWSNHLYKARTTATLLAAGVLHLYRVPRNDGEEWTSVVRARLTEKAFAVVLAGIETGVAKKRYLMLGRSDGDGY